MVAINAYLNFNGNTEEAFNFYKSVLGGEFKGIMRYGETPGCESMSNDEKNRIMHIALPFGDSYLMGTDIAGKMDPVVNGTSMSISVDTDSEEEARQIFAGLSHGGKILVPLEKMFWNALYGMVTDKFGIQWMVNYSDEPCI